MYSPGWYIDSELEGKEQEEMGKQEGRPRGGFKTTSFSLPPPFVPGSGLPHPPQGALLVTAAVESEEQTSDWAVLKPLSHLRQQVSET